MRVKIFYTECEGGGIFEKRISARKLRGLITEMQSVNLFSSKEYFEANTPCIKFIRTFKTGIHAIFIPVPNNKYRRWDVVNGWNDMSDDNIETLTKAVLANANQNKTKTKTRRKR